MQNHFSFDSNVRMTLAVACLCALALSGCTTTKKMADATPPAAAGPATGKSLAGRGNMLAKDGMLAKDTTLPRDSVLPKDSVVAKNGTTPSSLHIDPVASRRSARQAAQAQPGVQSLTSEQAAALAGSAPATAPRPENAFPPAPAPIQQASIAGLATQPTGVRADNGTIFSANPPAPPVPTGANGPVPADLPRRNFNAMTASVFSAPQPMPAASCGTDTRGNPLSC